MRRLVTLTAALAVTLATASGAAAMRTDAVYTPAGAAAETQDQTGRPLPPVGPHPIYCDLRPNVLVSKHCDG